MVALGLLISAPMILLWMNGLGSSLAELLSAPLMCLGLRMKSNLSPALLRKKGELSLYLILLTR